MDVGGEGSGGHCVGSQLSTASSAPIPSAPNLRITVIHGRPSAERPAGEAGALQRYSLPPLHRRSVIITAAVAGRVGPLQTQYVPAAGHYTRYPPREERVNAPPTP